MNKEKPIDEMAKHCTYYHNGECFACANHPTECDLMCEMFGVFANLEMAGYRKASEVAEEIFAEIDKLLIVDRNGEATLDVRDLAELKKKYTGGNNAKE